MPETKYFHVTHNPERIMAEGIKPGQPSCIHELYELGQWYLDNNGLEDAEFGYPILKTMVQAIGRCLESESVYLTTEPDYAKLNCLAPIELADNLHGHFQDLFTHSKKTIIDQSSDTRLMASLKKVVKKSPCYLCEVELDSDDLKQLQAPSLPPESLGVSRAKEIVLTHVPSENIKKCELIPLEEQLKYGRRYIRLGVD